MNYKRIHDLIIERARLRGRPIGPFHRHHVTMKSLGGNNYRSNLVKVTHREHYLLHLLLTKIMPCSQTFAAMARFAYSDMGIVLNSRQYAQAVVLADKGRAMWRVENPELEADRITRGTVTRRSPISRKKASAKTLLINKKTPEVRIKQEEKRGLWLKSDEGVAWLLNHSKTMFVYSNKPEVKTRNSVRQTLAMKDEEHKQKSLKGLLSFNKDSDSYRQAVVDGLRKMPTRARSGSKGVSLLKNGRYKARIMVSNKQITLGSFATVEEATSARESAEKEYF